MTRTHTHTSPVTGTPVPAPRAPADQAGPGPGAQERPGADVWLASEWLVACLGAMGCRRSGSKWQCPAHSHTGTHAASLAVGPRDDGHGAWVYCHAGCTLHTVLDAMGLRPAHLHRPPRVTPARHVELRGLRREWPELKAGHGGDPAAVGFRHESWHAYGPDHRKERLRRPGDGEKTMRWESRNPDGEWVPGLLGTREVDLGLYREHEVAMAAAAGETVVLCESESSCDALRGIYATTWAGGAANPPLQHFAQVLHAVDVVIVPDHDQAGLACLARLLEVLPHARVLLGEPGEDARDLHRRVGPVQFSEHLRTAAVAFESAPPRSGTSTATTSISRARRRRR